MSSNYRDPNRSRGRFYNWSTFRRDFDEPSVDTNSLRCNKFLDGFLKQKSSQRQIVIAHETAYDQEGENSNQVTLLPDDLLFKIFILLPAESLVLIQFVCKRWFSLVKDLDFIESHAKQAQTILICKKMAFSSLPGVPKLYYHFLDFERASHHSFVDSINGYGRVCILASCHGLILRKVESEAKLILANPLTRKHTELPLGTKGWCLYLKDEFYNLSFCNKAKIFKVVHMFRDREKYMNCEILSISTTRTWKQTDPFSPALLPAIKQVPVQIDGSLYWMPREKSCDYYVTMNLQDDDDQKFITMRLPTICSLNDRLLETGGLLGLVTNVASVMQIWTLTKRGDQQEEGWVKNYTVVLDSALGYQPVPICSLRNGKDMVIGFLSQRLYIYNSDTRDMKMVYSVDGVEAWGENIERLYFPHRNTLASWENHANVPTLIER